MISSEKNHNNFHSDDIIDFIFHTLDLNEKNNNSVNIKKRTDFDSQSEIYNRKMENVTFSLIDNKDELFLYIPYLISLYESSIKDIKTLLPINTSLKKIHHHMISHWTIPYIISAIEKSEITNDNIIHSSILLLKDWLYEILTGSEDTNKSIKSKSNDVDAFIRIKLFKCLGNDICADIKSDLASKKRWKSISFNDFKNKSLLDEIEIDLNSAGRINDAYKVKTILKAGGILRRSIGKVSIKSLTSADYNYINECMGIYILAKSDYLKRLSEFDSIDTSKEFHHALKPFLKKLSFNVINEENNDAYILLCLVNSLPDIIYDCDITDVLLRMHCFVEKFRPLHNTNLFDVSIYQSELVDSTDELLSLISEKNEHARKDLIDFIENIEGNSFSSKNIIMVSCFILAVSLIVLRRVEHNRMSKLLSIIRRNLKSNGEFCDLPSFTTCFNRDSGNIIDIHRFSKDSQLIAYSIRHYNQFIIKNLPDSYMLRMIANPLFHIDILLDNLVESYESGEGFDKKIAQKINQPKKFWRIDDSSAYECLRDLDFYYNVLGFKINKNKLVSFIGLDKYRNLSDEMKSNLLKSLDSKLHMEDIMDVKRMNEAKLKGEKQYIGKDGLPVYFFKERKGN